MKYFLPRNKSVGVEYLIREVYRKPSFQMTSSLLSLQLTTSIIVSDLPSLCEDSQDELHPITNAEAIEDSSEIRSDGGDA